MRGAASPAGAGAEEEGGCERRLDGGQSGATSLLGQGPFALTLLLEVQDLPLRGTAGPPGRSLTLAPTLSHRNC